MSIEAIQFSGTQSSDNTYHSPEIPQLGPNEILQFVQSRLGDINGQVDEYIAVVNQRQQHAQDLRTFQEVLRELDRNGTGYDSTCHGDTAGDWDDGAVAQLEKAKASIQDEDLQKTLNAFIDDIRDDHKIGHDDLNDYVQRAKNELDNLNSDNELTMMRMSALMQLRTQVVQFSSNVLASINDATKSTISNMRV